MSKKKKTRLESSSHALKWWHCVLIFSSNIVFGQPSQLLYIGHYILCFETVKIHHFIEGHVLVGYIKLWFISGHHNRHVYIYQLWLLLCMISFSHIHNLIQYGTNIYKYILYFWSVTGMALTKSSKFTWHSNSTTNFNRIICGTQVHLIK